jgi:transcriptional regulator with XRE-family HTH domain
VVTPLPAARSCERCGVRLARDNSDVQCSSCRRSSALKAPEVPRDFWNAVPMQHALATRHIGRVVYVYRTHPWHGRQLSQDVVGGWLGLTQPQLSRIESGRAIEDLGRLIRFAIALGIPRELLWFKLPDGDHGGTGSQPVYTLPVIVGGQPVLLPIDREAARAQGLDALLDQLADYDEATQQLDGLPFPVHATPQRNRAIPVLTTTDVAELEHLAAALDDARRYLDGSVVELLRAQLDRSKAEDGTHGPAKPLPIVLGILGAISQHVREVKPDVRRQLLVFGAEAAEFAGWLHRDLKDSANAGYWYDRAMEWAQAANDTAMQGYVLLKKSQAAYDERDAHQLATLAEAANRGPWQLPDRVRVEVTQQEARGLAMLGEPFAVVERKLDEADRLYAGADADDRPEFGTYFTEAAMATRRALCYVEAGKPAKAADLFGEVIASHALTRRDEGFFRALRSYACALSGEPDVAAEEGLSALSIATSTNSERTTRELSRTAKALTPWNSRPGPRRLREALAQAR